MFYNFLCSVFGAYYARANSEHTGFSHFTLLFRKMYLQRRARPLTVTVTVTVHRQFTYTCIFLSFCLIQSILLRLSAASKIERRSQRRKVCLCSRDHSHSSSSSAHFILEQFSFRFFFSCSALETCCSVWVRVLQSCIITNDTLNRFSLYIACNNNILLFASNLPFSIFVLHKQ